MASVIVQPDGTTQFIYHDELLPLKALGSYSARRASHVEPSDCGLWTADLSPVQGPILGPFETRREALDAEVAWLSRAMEC